MAGTATAAVTIMADAIATAGGQQSLLRLMTWLSPAFPVGGFVYSGGLEAAVDGGHLADGDGLAAWLSTLLSAGSLRNDAILLGEAHRAFDDPERLLAVAELASALAGSAERYSESVRQGDAFLAAASAWPHAVLDVFSAQTAYSVAVGAVAGAHGVTVCDTLAAYLHAQCAQLVSAAIRLGLIGQRQGVAVLAGLEPLILRQSQALADLTPDDLGSATVIADMLSMRHETQYSRLFQS